MNPPPSLRQPKAAPAVQRRGDAARQSSPGTAAALPPVAANKPEPRVPLSFEPIHTRRAFEEIRERHPRAARRRAH